MDYRLYVKGSPESIELMKSYVALINRLHIEGDGVENEEGVMWILRNVDEKDIPLFKEHSRKTPSLTYDVTVYREKRK